MALPPVWHGPVAGSSGLRAKLPGSLCTTFHSASCCMVNIFIGASHSDDAVLLSLRSPADGILI